MRACLAAFSVPLGRPTLPTLFPYTTLFRSNCCLTGEVSPVKRQSSLPRQARHRSARASAQVPQHVLHDPRSEEHTSELQSPCNLVCRLLLEKKKRRESAHDRTVNRMSEDDA